MYSNILQSFTPTEILIIWIGICALFIVLAVVFGIMWAVGRRQGKEIKVMRKEVDKIPDIYERLNSMDEKLDSFQKYMEEDTENRKIEIGSVLKAVADLSQKIDDQNQEKSKENGVSD